MRRLLVIIAFISCMAHAEEPWGNDAELAAKRVCRLNDSPRCRTPIIGPLAEVLIRFHQEVISPADGPRSHHKPSSSQYTLDAMRQYGFFSGFLMGCDRLMRENNDPWIYPIVEDAAGDTFKWDPVK
ncbi:MAG: membrane protein insertion efficiency factor YidD [Waddliaceae bacterium]